MCAHCDLNRAKEKLDIACHVAKNAAIDGDIKLETEWRQRAEKAVGEYISALASVMGDKPDH